MCIRDRFCQVLKLQHFVPSSPSTCLLYTSIDGAGEFYTFNKIVLPIMKPALAVQAIFSFVASWNNYFIPALVLDTCLLYTSRCV